MTVITARGNDSSEAMDEVILFGDIETALITRLTSDLAARSDTATVQDDGNKPSSPTPSLRDSGSSGNRVDESNGECGLRGTHSVSRPN